MTAACSVRDASFTQLDAPAADGSGLDALIDAPPIDGAAMIDATVIDSLEIDASMCGDDMHGNDVCDGVDLAGQTCMTLGFAGGSLACNSMCTGFDLSGCAAPPTPVLRRPLNGTYMGAIAVPGSLNPLFVWSASTWSGSGAIGYELDLATDPGFPSATPIAVAMPSYQTPSDLPVATTAPAGARYYWRVRACFMGRCSANSTTWRVNVGRSDRDFNGDGSADILVGATSNDVAGTDAGAVYVFLSDATGVDSVADGTLLGGAPGDGFGNARSAGDVNGDGYADIIAGADHSDAAGTDAGRAYIYLGGPGATFDPSPDATLAGAAVGDLFGAPVASAGDVNGDGFADVIVGAINNDVGGADAGRAYVFFGGPGAGFDAVADGVLTGATAGDYFGTGANAAGDVNGDGFGDVVVGAYLNDVGGNEAGRAYVYLGGPGMALDPAADGVLTGAAIGDQLGVSAASAGDVNSDGFADVIVGAYGADASGTDSGRAYVYFGQPGPTFNGVPDGVLNGLGPGDAFGVSVASAGDVNGDGFSDVVVGGLYNDAAATNAGAAYVYLGGPGTTFETVNDGALLGSVAAGQFGQRVASTGDVNRDGLADVIVGAPYAGAGRAYVYWGQSGAAFDPAVDRTFSGVAGGDLFGIAVD